MNSKSQYGGAFRIGGAPNLKIINTIFFNNYAENGACLSVEAYNLTLKVYSIYKFISL